LLLQNKQCRNCHALGGVGGERGPALDSVATRLTKAEMVRQVIQGGGNMPAYGKKLNPAEVEALVSYMQTLRPKYVPAARDSATPLNPGAKGAPSTVTP
jgi:ubiquinol-cytochrome c reductase cytochrome b subunit